eukprot:TRINITY_DN6702_c0_g1_i1.p1 TRINITY_DN6702_c0_g1~~TRINITY_DN6702_c0_g1_i1.p1  ORF type:complete len:189 (+),score=86.19 TRINITY_DN6702_c0_g1_i1:97-663(+)
MALPASTKLERANRFKEEGNAFFRQNDLRKALGSYHKVVLHVVQNKSPLPGIETGQGFLFFLINYSETAEQVEEMKKLQVVALQNMALCHLKLNEPKKTIEDCKKVLELDKNSVKAYFFRGQAYLKIFYSADAEDDLTKALELAPTDPKIRAELARARQLNANAQRQQNQAFSGMFEKLAALEEFKNQ